MEKNNNISTKQSLFVRLLRLLVGILIFSALLFLPAGRIDWMEAWALLILFFTYVIILSAWGWRHDPQLMKERSKFIPEGEKWDKIIMGIYTILLFTLFITTGLDGGRFHWSNTPIFLKVLGWLGFGFAMIIGWRVMYVNTYLSRSVRIQEERGHQVITNGPYRFIRHPMYLGAILYVLCIPMVLDSIWSFIPSFLIVVLFIIRTALEDHTLIEKLPGYKEYTKNVQYRLIPFVWLN